MTGPAGRTTSHPQPSPLPPLTSLARCTGDIATFLDRYWGRAPQHCVGADPAAFADLLSLHDVDALVSSPSARTPAFRLVRDGTPLDPRRYTRTARIGGQSVSGVADPGAIFEEFRKGATVVFQGLQRSCPPVARFCRGLETELSHAVQANAYVTPAGSQGLRVHYDTHDVFVLQLAGSKHWSIYPPVLGDPLPSQPWKGAAIDAGDPCLTVELRAGDSLYVPRGFLHAAEAQRELSAHLTIGVVPTTWHDVVTGVVAGVADDVEFRRALPVGFTADPEALAAEVADALVRLRKWLDEVDAQAVAADLIRRFWAGRPQSLTGQLHQILALDSIGDQTWMRRRPDSVCHLSSGDDVLTVGLGGRELRMPAVLEPVIARIAAGEAFRPVDLADLLDGPSRLTLVRRLVVEGLLVSSLDD